MLALRQPIRSLLLAACVLVLAAAAPMAAHAQGKLEAQYTVTLAGIPIGKGNWVIDINDTHYKAAASGITTGLMLEGVERSNSHYKVQTMMVTGATGERQIITSHLPIGRLAEAGRGAGDVA